MAQSPLRICAALLVASLLGASGCTGPHPIPPDFSDDEHGRGAGDPGGLGGQGSGGNHSADDFGNTGGAGGGLWPPGAGDGGVMQPDPDAGDGGPGGADAGVEDIDDVEASDD